MKSINMKNRILSCILVLLLIVSVTQIEQVHASHRTEADSPVLKKLVIKNAENVEGTLDMEIEVDLADEPVVGNGSLDLYFEDGEGHSSHVYLSVGDGTSSYSGVIYGGCPGTYTLKSVILNGSVNNIVKYNDSSAVTLDDLGIEREINVTKDNTLSESTEVKSLIIRDPEEVDANGILIIDTDIENSNIEGMILWFENSSGYKTPIAKWGIFIEGTAEINLQGDLPEGENILSSVEFIGNNFHEIIRYDKEQHRYYTVSDPGKIYTEADITSTINVINSTVDYSKAEVNSLNILNPDLTLPASLKVEADITSEDSVGIRLFSLCFRNSEGREINTPYYPEEIMGKRTGKWTVDLPFGPVIGDGEYTLEKITIRNEDWQGGTVYEGDELDEICPNRTITLHSPYDVTYEGDLGNTEEVMDVVGKMNEGETVVLDAKEETVVPKALFSSIAGQDKNVVFTTENTEWIFNGKDVSKSASKNINVQTRLKQENGKNLGFDGDNKILMIDFQNNGVLPGKAQVRISDPYISAKYLGGQDRLILAYISNNRMSIEDTNVVIEGDRAAAMTIKHNSKFTLSSRGVSLKRAKVTAKKCIYSGKKKKPAVTVKVGTKVLSANMYKKKYKDNVGVGTAKVTVSGIKRKSEGEKTGRFYINPKKAVISKITAGKKKITVRMKSRPSRLGASAYKIKYRVTGKKNWITVKTTGAVKTIKKLKKGKRYQVKVRAYKGKREGAYSKTKTSPRVR